MKKIFFVVVLISFALITSSSQAYVSLAVTSQTIPSIIEPGAKANIILTITNSGNDYARSITLKMRSNSYIRVDQVSYDLQTIAPSSSMQLTIPITVDASAPEGTNALFFTIDYLEGSSTGTVTKEGSISLTVTKRVQIQIEDVKFSKDIIQQGDDIVVSFNMKNVGKGEIKDLRASLEDYTLPFVYITNEKYIGNLASSKSTQTIFNLIINKDAKTIAYNLPVNLNYYDEAGVLHTDKKYVGIKISGMPEFVTAIEKTERMAYGNTGKMSISISNRGTAVAQFLTAEFDSNLDITPKEIYVGNLDPDDSSTISIDVDLSNVAEGEHSLNMTLQYKDPYNKDFKETHVLKFDVTSRPVEIPFTIQVVILAAVLAVAYWKRSSIIRLLRRK